MDKEHKQVVTPEYTDVDIKGMIYRIRGQQVMLDLDLAKLYGYSVKRLNEQVKRNIDRFPEDFMFQLTLTEIPEYLKSQFATLNKNKNKRGLHIKKMPYVFTEQGVNQLSAVLKGPIAVRQSILIMRTFVKMRHFLMENRQLLGNEDVLKIMHLLMEDTARMKDKISDVKKDVNSIKQNVPTKKEMQNTINKILDSFIPKESIKQFVFKDNQPFEANEAYITLYKQAKNSIYVIDDYINCHTLSLLSAKKDSVNVIIFSDNKGRGGGKLNALEFDNFNKEYPSLFIKKNNNKCHDRFIIIDYNTNTEKIYHCGASSKDAGKKICCISLFSTSNSIHLIIDDLLKNEEYIFDEFSNVVNSSR